MAGPELSRQQADTELDRLDAECAAISTALLELDNHPGHLLLRAATLRGETLRRWTPARAALAALHQQFEAYRGCLARAHELRSQREFRELTDLLRDASIELSNEALPLQRRSLTGPTAVVERISLSALVTRMNTEFAQVASVVADADGIWSAVVRRLDQAQERISAARALAGGLALAGGDGVLAAELDRLDAELAELRERLAGDPLSVPAESGEQLPVRAGALLDRLAEVAAVRDGFVERIAAARAAVDRVRAAEAELAATRETVLVKIAASALPPVTDRSTALLGRLDGLAALGEGGQWPRLAHELPALEREAAGEVQRLRAEREAIGSLLERRNELRGRLDAYRAKAAGIGHSEDRELERLHGVAHDLLWTAPCDLAAATRALARYQHAVSAREGAGDG